MVTRAILFFLFFSFSAGFQSVYAEGKQLGQVEISFDYNRADRDYANNQFAVWIEDLDGNLIKTLFVTHFTVTKGWKTRKEALPTWRKKANISHLEKKDVDTISGATPKGGRLYFTWETDQDDGSFVPARDYNYLVECNYYWEDTVLYKGMIQLGKNEDSSKASPKFSTKNAKKYNLIENVKAKSKRSSDFTM